MNLPVLLIIGFIALSGIFIYAFAVLDFCRRKFGRDKMDRAALTMFWLMPFVLIIYIRDKVRDHVRRSLR